MPRCQAGGLLTQCVGLGRSFVFPDAVDADHVVEQPIQAGGLDGQRQHRRVTVAQDAGDDAALSEFAQHVGVLRERTQAAVLVHQPFDRRLKVWGSTSGQCWGHEALEREHQCRAGQCPKRLVVSAIIAGGNQAGVLDLFVAPQHADRLTLAREQLFGQQSDAVHIKQSAIGIEQYGLGFFHEMTVLQIRAPINGGNWARYVTFLLVIRSINCAAALPH